MEGLELSYSTIMRVWDRIPEPMSLIHLHNMLVKKGYITAPVGMFATLQELLPASFFLDGKAPTSNFGHAFLSRTGEKRYRTAESQRRTAATRSRDVHTMLDSSLNLFFRTKSNLLMYRQGGWNLDPS
jgi:hypothetical protein